jgi:prepilin-type processing-associated H-X9-DG protein
LDTLGGKWYQFRLADTTGISGYSQMLSSMYGGAGSLDYFTSGQRVTIDGASYLVAYSIQTKPMDLMSMMRIGTPPTPTPLTADTPLNPALLNIHAIAGMVDIRPFDLQSMIAQSTQQTIVSQSEVAQSLTTKASSNAKQVMLGAIMYSQDYDEKYPPMTSEATFKKAVYPYLRSDSAFLDPVTNTPFELNPWLSRRSLSQIDSPATMVAIYSDPHPDGSRVVGFADGHVKVLNGDDWAEAKAASHMP